VRIRHRFPPVVWFCNFILPCLRCRFYVFLFSHFKKNSARDLGITASAAEGSARAFSLEGPGVTITAAAAVTGGASQATFASAANNTAKFLGVVRFEQLGEGVTAGKFTASDATPVQTRGKIYVPVAENADPQDKKPAYVILTGENAGLFTDASGGGNYDCGCIFRGGRISGNLALIELRGMK
jgi:hypothetical protein